ncbi:MAG: Ig-like domain-containing protein [Burkholderiaceae bacterium]
MSSGFSGSLDWVAGASGVGNGADGQGGVGIRPAVTATPLVGALVTVRGADGTAIGSAPTGADGRVTLKACTVAGPFLIEVAGTSTAAYVDPANGSTAAFGPGESMRALVAALTANIGVTPWTEAVVRRVMGTASAASSDRAVSLAAKAKALPTGPAIDVAHQQVLASAFTGLFPQSLSIESLTLMPRTADGASLADRPADRYALALATLGYGAAAFNPGLTAPSLAAARQFALDAADGKLDGRDAEGSPVSAVMLLAYDPGQLRAALDAALAAAARALATAALRDRTSAPLAMGAYAVPGSGAKAVVRLERNGSVLRLNADGSTGATIDTEVVALFSASQPPASALFLKRRDGSVAAVGSGGAAGVLGLGANVDRAAPAAIGSLGGASMISLGASHALARMANGTVLGWGDGSHGQLGEGVALSAQPSALAGLSQVMSVLALKDLSLALQQDGRVLAWGTGAAALGQPSLDTRTQTLPQPVQIAGGSPLDQVLALAGFAGPADATFAALRRDGTVWAWGENVDGGLGAAGASRGVAGSVAGLSNIVGIASTDRGFIAIDTAGALFFWGSIPLDAGSGAPTTYSGPFTPQRLDGLPAARVVQPAFAGLYQARVLTQEGGRWQTDGIGARETAPAGELDVHAIGTGIVTIAVVSGDDFVNAAERSAGVVVRGVVSEADRPVTLQVGGNSIAAQVSGTAWSATLPESALPISGQVVLLASFQRAAGGTAVQTSRTITVDAVAPAATISDDVPGTAGGPVTFTFSWSEAPLAFGPDAVTVSNGTKGSFTQVSGTTFTLQVAPPPDSVGELTVTLAAGAASDAAGNPSLASATARQAFRTDVTPPALTLSQNIPGLALGPVTLTLQWSEPVLGFTADKVVVSNAQKGPLVAVDARTYSMLLTPPASDRGEISVSVAAGAARDAADNASTAASLSFQFDTALINFDYTGGGVGGDSGGESGSAGDAGTPGILPDAFVVTPDTSTGNLLLVWDRHPATGGDANSNIAYYLVLERDNDRSALTRFVNKIQITASTPANARFGVRVGNGTSTASYRIRACNGGSGSSGLPQDKPGENWCRDSSEFRVDGTAYPPEHFYPDQAQDIGNVLTVTINSGGSGWKTGPFTVSFSWNTEVGEFRADDISVDRGTISNFTGSGREYSALVTPPANAFGTLAVTVRAGAVRSMAPLPNGHQSAETTAQASFGTLQTTNTSGRAGELAVLAGYPTLFSERARVDGTGLDARFLEAMQMTLDSGGTLYVSDYPTIRRISSAGVVTTQSLAITSSTVNPVDGTLSTATIRAATALTAGGTGVVYFADSFNDGVRIRRLNASGVTTLVGAPQGMGTADGLAYDAPRNLLYVADRVRHVIWRVALSPTPSATVFAGTLNVSGTQNGTGTAARFYLPEDVAVDASGNVYVADSGNNVVRRIAPSGTVGVVSLYAGAFGPFEGYVDAPLSVNARFGSPKALAVDAANNVYVVEPTNHSVRRISSSGAVTTIVGNGSPGMALGPVPGGLFSPQDVAVIAGQTLAILGFGVVDPVNTTRGFGGMVFVARPAATQWP